MKKLIIACLIATAATAAATAHAGYTGPGEQAEAMTVKQLQDAGKDDQRVVLRGHIVKATGDEKYTFSDGTAEIPVKIDHKRWPAGQQVNEQTTVELTGKYDKEFFGMPKVKVYEIRVVQ